MCVLPLYIQVPTFTEVVNVYMPFACADVVNVYMLFACADESSTRRRRALCTDHGKNHCRIMCACMHALVFGEMYLQEKKRI